MRIRNPERFSRKRAVRSHVKLRAFDRLGLFMTDADIRHIGELIRNGRAVLVTKQKYGTRAVYDVDYNDRTYRVVYGVKERQVISILPNEFDWEQGGGEFNPIRFEPK